MLSTGTCRRTGRPLSGWPHVEQSIGVILTTPIGARVMRREFGSEVPELIGRPLTERVILAVIAASANALARWEPRFGLTDIRPLHVDAEGRLVQPVFGVHLPNGHLGDDTAEGSERLVSVLLGVAT